MKAPAAEVEVAPGAVALALPRHEYLDLLLKQSLPRLAEQFWQIAEWALEIKEAKHYERLGFEDFPVYLESRGFRYRTLMRGIAVVEAHRQLPPGEQPEAKAALLGLGIHKAGVLAPVLALPAGQEGARDWRAWVEDAGTMSEEALQEAVTDARGLPTRASEAPGARFLRQILAQVPPETKEQVEWVFRAFIKKFEMQPMSVFLTLVSLGEQELRGHGVID